MWVPTLGQEGALEAEMWAHSSILARKFHAWTEAPWGLKQWDMTKHTQRSTKSSRKHSEGLEQESDLDLIGNPLGYCVSNGWKRQVDFDYRASGIQVVKILWDNLDLKERRGVKEGNSLGQLVASKGLPEEFMS